MGTKRNSQKLWEQRHKDRKFATPRVMQEIKCSQVVANSKMNRAKAEGKTITDEGGFICGEGERCICGGGGYSFRTK
jgi:hypothetical protein